MRNRFVSVSLLALCLCGTVSSAQTPQPAPGKPFSDVPPNHWAAASVEKLRRAGIVVGETPTHTSGKKPLTQPRTAPKQKHK